LPVCYHTTRDTCDRVTDTMVGRVSLAEASYAEASENIERVFRTDD
jgi:hypothetical protein